MVHVRFAVGFRDERYRSRGTWVRFDDVHLVVLDGKLDVDEAHRLQRQCDALGVLFNLADDQIAQVVRRQHRVAVAAVDAGRFDVLHDANDAHLIAIADGIRFAFNGPIEVVIEQDLVVRHVPENIDDMPLKFVLVDDDLHALSAQYIARSHQQRETEFLAELVGFVGGFHHAEVRVWNPFVAQQRRERPAVFSQVQRTVARTDDFDAVALELLRQLQCGLATQLHDDPLGLFVQDDVVNVLPENGLEIQFIRCIRVGRHRLGIAVDHDGLVPAFLCGEHPVDATVIEFDALADAVGATA